jgi:hypothetical protein
VLLLLDEGALGEVQVVERLVDHHGLDERPRALVPGAYTRPFFSST